MYYDLGFSDWVFEIEQTDGNQIADRLREVRKNYDQAKKRIAAAMEKIDRIYAAGTDFIKKML